MADLTLKEKKLVARLEEEGYICFREGFEGYPYYDAIIVLERDSVNGVSIPTVPLLKDRVVEEAFALVCEQMSKNVRACV